MAKFLQVKMKSDGTTWRIPAEIVANDRTNYYMGKPEPEFTREEEFAASMEDDELIDWAGNNMNWSDVEGRAVKIETAARIPNYESDWNNGGFKIVERESATDK